MDLEEKVAATIEKHRMFSRGEGVLVAVSGGPDSVALLHFLLALSGPWKLRLEVVHVEHGIRGREAREDARFVSLLAKDCSLPFHLRQLSLSRLRQARGGGNLEAMARAARYNFFARLARERGLGRVATGHSRDDQIETLLMWLLRGSGGRGLGGMPPVRELDSGALTPRLVRPLIEVSRREILDYLAAKHAPFRNDRTNLDPTRLRNWIRLELLPILRAKLDSRLDERLARTAALVRDEEELLRDLASRRFADAVRGGGLSREAFAREGRAMQRRLFRRWLEANKGDLRAVGFEHVDTVLDFIAHGPPQGRLSIPGGWEFVKAYDLLRLRRRSKQVRRAEYRYPVPEQGELHIPEAAMTLRCSRLPERGVMPPRSDDEALFDLAGLPGNLAVRNFRPGDRLRPLGMRGHKKVKDLFIEKRIPSSVRAMLPLLVSGQEILWVPRCGRSGVAAVGPKTRGVLHLELIQSARE